MKLTKPQLDELKLLAQKPQTVYGSSRARVQNNLRALGLAEYLMDDGTVWKPKTAWEVVFGRCYSLCRITEAGRAALAATKGSR